MKKILSICTVFTALMIMVETHAASFNCNKAQTSTEHRICNTLSLNDADVKMVTTYNIVRRLVPMGTRSEIRAEQVRWLELRDECQDNIECLKHVYEMRQQKLDMYMDRVYRQGPF
ncbi:MAG: hypothetical protein KA518_03555 [Acinetobacter sp.]|nr:hypothetical protein [Acinetobacter sp.]